MRIYRKIHQARRNESGSVLLAALCLIFMAGMLTGTVLMYSRISTADIYSHVQLQRSAYINEGVANRIQWLIAADRYVNTTSSELGELDYTEYEYDRYAADGIPHDINYHGTEVKVTILDAVSGFDMSGNNYQTLLNRLVSALELEDTSINDTMTALSAKINDYIDSDDNLTDEGMENPEYEEKKMSPLPRNGAMRYREELVFIPGFTDMFPPDDFGRLSGIRLFTPAGMTSLNANGNKPSFMTATPLMLKAIGNLEDEEVEEVINARKEWLKEKTPLSEQLDALLLSRLHANFSWTESGFYEIRIEAPDKSNRPSRKLFFTFPAFDIGGSSDEMVHYYDWLML